MPNGLLEVIVSHGLRPPTPGFWEPATSHYVGILWDGMDLTCRAHGIPIDEQRLFGGQNNGFRGQNVNHPASWNMFIRTIQYTPL